MNQLVQGIITPILTPMYEDESINFDELRNQVNRLIAAGVSGLFCFGTNGESYIISEEEKYAVLSCVIEETGICGYRMSWNERYDPYELKSKRTWSRCAEYYLPVFRGSEPAGNL